MPPKSDGTPEAHPSRLVQMCANCRTLTANGNLCHHCDEAAVDRRMDEQEDCEPEGLEMDGPMETGA